MIKTLLSTLRHNWLTGLILPLLLVGSGGVWAQSVASYVTARTTGTTYTSISSTGTSFSGWRNTLSTDDNLSVATPIGFAFAYDGSVYTQFSVSTNGFLTLNTGTTSTGSGLAAYGYQNTQFSTAAGTVTTLAPFYDDQQTAGNLGTLADLNASMKYLTTGTMGNRVLTAEWINMQDFSTTSTSGFNYQVKLYEADGHIEFNYGTMALSNTSTVTTMSYSLGINSPTGGPTAANLLTQQTANTNTFGSTASDALGGSTAAGLPATNSQCSFTAPVPAALTTLAFNSLSISSMMVSFVDNSTTENNFLGVFSTDPTFATFFTASATSTTKAATGTAYSFNLTSLSSSTTYYVRIAAVTEANSPALAGSQATPAGFAFGPGPYTIDNSVTTGGTNFANFTDAINTLNTGTVTGPLTFNVAANATPYVELPPSITKSGSAGNFITFQRAPTATSNPVILSPTNTGAGTTDYIVRISGADYLVFDGIDLSDVNSAAGTTAQQREWGYFIAPASTTDGAQNNAVRNCIITLNGGASTTPNTGSYGILLSDNGLVAANATTAPNSGNKFNGNTINGPVIGIYIAGISTTVAANQDAGNEIGSTAGNTINAKSGTASGYGVRVDYASGTKTENNIISLIGTTGTSTLRGVGYGASAGTGINGAVLINNNTITLSTAGTSTVWGINQAGTSTPTSVAITNNKVQNSTLTGATGTVNGIEDGYNLSTGTSTITGNQITGNSATTTGSVSWIYRSGAAGTVNMNGTTSE